MIDVVEARPRGGYRVHLRFEDGVEGEIDLAELIRFEGVFAPLRDPARFAEVLELVVAFADPVLGGEVGERMWRSAQLEWQQ